MNDTQNIEREELLGRLLFRTETYIMQKQSKMKNLICILYL